MEWSFAGGGQLCMKVCYSNFGLLSRYVIPNILQIRISHSHFRFALILKCFLWIMCQIWFSFTIWNQVFKNWKLQKKLYVCDRTQTCNPWVRCPMPYPLGHTTWYELSCTSEGFILCSGMVKWIKKMYFAHIFHHSVSE